MNKKLIILIVALECVFSVFLISIFGPMIESFHSRFDVRELYFVDENGKRLDVDENGNRIENVVIELEADDRSCHLSWCVLPENATETTVDIEITRGTEVLGEDGFVIVTPDGDGKGARFTFRQHTDFIVTIYTTDGSGISASVMLSFAVDDTPSDIDPFA